MNEYGISHARALELLRDGFAAVAGSERVKLEHALGRCLDAPVTAKESIPSFDNSAVDGYALSRSTLEKSPGGVVRVEGRVAAGETAPPLLPGAACRIFTGAPVTEGADVVLMDEDVPGHGTDADGAWIRLPENAPRSSNIRRRGEDVSKGDEALGTGMRLRPQDLAAAASMGMSALDCRRRVRVAVFSTGAELREPSAAKSSPASIVDSNRVLLSGLLKGLPVDVHDGGILPDDRDAITGALLSASQRNDLLLTSGGAGRGEEDHLVRILEKHGELLFRRIAIKPGRPLSVGFLPKGGPCGCIALPGNPVAVMVCFLMYARPVLLRLCGGGWDRPRHFNVAADFSMSKKPGRREFQRGILRCKDDALAVARFEEQGSGILRSLRIADGLIELDEDVTQVSKGDEVRFLPFSSMGIDAP